MSSISIYIALIVLIVQNEANPSYEIVVEAMHADNFVPFTN